MQEGAVSRSAQALTDASPRDPRKEHGHADLGFSPRPPELYRSTAQEPLMCGHLLQQSHNYVQCVWLGH